MLLPFLFINTYPPFLDTMAAFLQTMVSASSLRRNVGLKRSLNMLCLGSKFFYDFVQYMVGGYLIGIGLKVQHKPVIQGRYRHLLHVLKTHVDPAVEECHRLGGQYHCLSSPGAGAIADIFSRVFMQGVYGVWSIFQMGLAVWLGGHDYLHDVILDFRGDQDFPD